MTISPHFLQSSKRAQETSYIHLWFVSLVRPVRAASIIGGEATSRVVLCGLGGLMVAGLIVGMIRGILGTVASLLFAGPLGWALSTITLAGEVAGFVAGQLLMLAVWLACSIMLSVVVRARIPAHSLLKSLAITSPASLLAVLPYAGTVIALSWWSTCAGLILLASYPIGRLKLISVLHAPAALLIGAWYLYGIGGGGLFTGLSPSRLIAPDMEEIEGRIVFDAIKLYARNHGGHGPSHFAVLLLPPSYFPGGLLYSPSGNPETATIGSHDIQTFYQLSNDQQSRTVDEVVAALPAEFVAHRVDDFVFTYHKIDVTTAHAELWIFVRFSKGGEITMWGLDGRITKGLVVDAERLIAEQNGHRAASGYPQLPNFIEDLQDGIWVGVEPAAGDS